MSGEENFTIIYREQPILIDMLSTGSAIIYRVHLDTSSSFFITRAQHADGHRFWTSLPEGRQKEAEEIGIQIEKHFHSKT